MLVALVERFNEKRTVISEYLRSYLLLVKPETVLKWHRELVRRKWTFKKKQTSSPPRLNDKLEALMVGLARENPPMGYDNIQGELFKLGYQVDATPSAMYYGVINSLWRPNVHKVPGAYFLGTISNKC